MLTTLLIRCQALAYTALAYTENLSDDVVIASLRGTVAALPVEQVSWFDAVEFVNARSRQAGLTPAYTISASGAACEVTPAKRH